MESCVTANSPAGEPVYGSLNNINHNLLRVRDGRARLILENRYDTDPRSFSFDRVKEQRVGDEAVTYRYYDLADGNTILDDEDISRVERQPSAVEVCRTACEMMPVSGASQGGERWVRMDDETFLVFPEPAEQAPTRSWAVSGDGRDGLKELSGHRWYELRWNGDKATLTPPVGLLSRALTVAMPTGDLLLRQHRGRSGDWYPTGDPKTLATAFPERGSVLTLVHTPEGWRAIRRAAVGGVQVVGSNRCTNEFSVRAESGRGPRTYPSNACRGEVGMRELGRRFGAGAPKWNSLLTDPRTVNVWSFGSERSALAGTTWRGDPFRTLDFDRNCPTTFPPIVPEEGCLAAAAAAPEGGLTPPACDVGWSSRGSVPGSFEPDDLPVALRCGVPPEVPQLPPDCLEIGRYSDRVARVPHSDLQPITRATVVVDATGVAWTYYTGSDGTVLRLVNAATGSQIDWNYDREGRLVGTRSAFGDRSCVQYDERSNPVRMTALPAPGHWAPFPYFEQRVSYDLSGRPEVVYDPAQDALTPILRLDWDGRGTLKALRHSQESGDEIVYRFEHDDRGRVEREILPTGSVNRFVYDPATGVPVEIILAEGSPIERRRTISPNAQGFPHLIEEPGKPTVERFWTGDGRLLEERVTLEPGSNQPPIVTTYFYDEAGELQTVIGPETTTEYTWNTRGLLESVRRYANGQIDSETACFAYRAGRLVASIDPEGRWEILERDGNGDVVVIRQGVRPLDGSPWQARCADNLRDGTAVAEEVFQVATRAADRGGITERQELGPAATGVSRDAQADVHAYDGFGRLYQVTLSNGVIHRAGHDRAGRTAWVAVYAPGATQLPAEVSQEEPNPSDPNLRALVHFDYDRRGRVVDERQLWFTDDEVGRRTFLGNGGWLLTRYAYDDVAGRVTVTDAEQRVTRISYDELGRVGEVLLPDGATTMSFEFADNGRTVTRRVAPAAAEGGALVETRQFTTLGVLHRAFDAAQGMIFEAQFDRLGRIETLGTLLQTLKLSYDGFGRQFAVARVRSDSSLEPFEARAFLRNGLPARYRDGRGNEVTYRYDAFNRTREAEFPDSSRVQYEYFPGTGDVRRIVDRRGDEILYERDAYGGVRKTTGTRVEAGGTWRTELSFQRGPLGIERATVNSEFAGIQDLTGSSSVAYRRDSRGNIVAEANALFASDILTYTRDALGRATRWQWRGIETERRFDALGRIVEVLHGSQLLASYVYEGFGPARRLIFNNGLTDEREYDREGRLRRFGLMPPATGSTPIVSEELFWALDRTLARLDTSIAGRSSTSSVFLNDPFGRLEAAAHGLVGLAPAVSGRIERLETAAWLGLSANAEQFLFDEADNFIRVEREGAVVSPTAGSDNRYLSFDGTVNSDAAGNVIGLPNNNSFTYDGLNRLRSATTVDGEQWLFRYDPFGRLTGWEGPDGKVLFLYAGGQVAWDTDGISETDYAPGHGLGPVAASRRGGPVFFYHETFGDRLKYVTDASGGLAERIEYDAYAAPSFFSASGDLLEVSALGSRLLLTGQPYLPEFALHRQGMRWYHPRWGRFLTPDPLWFFDGPNRYLYAAANPLMFVDPTGLDRRGAGRGALRNLDDCLACNELYQQIGRNVAPFATYRGTIEHLQQRIAGDAQSLGDALHDLTGSVVLAGSAATAFEYFAGMPVGIFSLGLLPETLWTSPQRVVSGSGDVVSGISEGDVYRALRGVSVVSGEIGTWAGLAAGALEFHRGPRPRVGGPSRLDCTECTGAAIRNRILGLEGDSAFTQQETVVSKVQKPGINLPYKKSYEWIELATDTTSVPIETLGIEKPYWLNAPPGNYGIWVGPSPGKMVHVVEGLVTDDFRRLVFDHQIGPNHLTSLEALTWAWGDLSKAVFKIRKFTPKTTTE